QLAGAAGHEQEDDAFGPGRVVRPARSQRVDDLGLLGRQPPAREQRGQRDLADADGAVLEEMPPGLQDQGGGLIHGWWPSFVESAFPPGERGTFALVACRNKRQQRWALLRSDKQPCLLLQTATSKAACRYEQSPTARTSALATW